MASVTLPSCSSKVEMHSAFRTLHSFTRPSAPALSNYKRKIQTKQHQRLPSHTLGISQSQSVYIRHRGSCACSDLPNPRGRSTEFLGKHRATCVPADRKQQRRAEALCPSKVRRQAPSARDHSRTVLSPLAVASACMCAALCSCGSVL